MTASENDTEIRPQGVLLDDLEEPVTPPITELDVVEPNIALTIAAVVLVLAVG